MSTTENTRGRRSFIAKSTLSIAGLLTAQSGIRSVFADTAVPVNSVPTLTGPADVSTLGTTLMHEHVLFGTIPSDLRLASIDIAVRLLKDAQQAGVDTIVDVSPYRDVSLYREIADKTTIRIVASTGYYKYETTPAALADQREAQMEERMYREVTEGIDGTKIRAGIIKVAADEVPLPAWNQKVFRAAARVQKATGVPIATHAWIGAKEQFEFLLKAGADPAHINFGHVDTVNGWHGKNREQFAAELLPIVAGGGYLLFNNFSCEFYTPWTDLVFLLRFFCDKGYSNRVLISEDCNWEWKNGKQIYEAAEEHPEAAKRTYAYMMTHEVPLMRKAGFTSTDIKTFMVDNPRRFFSH